MPNVYLSQGDLVKLATFNGCYAVIGDKALDMLDSRLRSIAEYSIQVSEMARLSKALRESNS